MLTLTINHFISKAPVVGLFKVTLTTLSTHGYTVIAKGIEQKDIAHLRHVAVIYQLLRLI